MRASFQENYSCPTYVHDMYTELERGMMPMIKRKAAYVSRIIPGVDTEDAIQEGRLALLSCLARYDCNKCDFELKRYVGRALRNTYAMMLYEAMAQRRMPRIQVRDEQGAWLPASRAPISLDDLVGYEPVDIAMSPEATALERERATLIYSVIEKVTNQLNGRDREIFKLMCQPNSNFLFHVMDIGGDISSPTNLDIVSYLNSAENPSKAVAPITKNQVDWSIAKIRLVFTQVMKDGGEDSEALNDEAKKTWPKIHISYGVARDIEFIDRIKVKYQLNRNGCEGNLEYAKEGDDANYWGRQIDKYSWGVVLTVKRGDEWATMVVKGKFNSLVGDVFGTERATARDRVPVLWYQQLAKKLHTAGVRR
jgi:hypothetical protein